MEERVAGDGSDDPSISPASSNDNEHLSPPSAPPEKSTSTYVIQVPRDQVYRIPPPENATIVENHRKPINGGKNACGGRLICTFFAVMLIGLAMLFGINHFSNHKSPEFSVVRFGRKASKSSENHPPNDNSTNRYGISLRVFNPNKKLEIHYGAGNVTLNYKGHEIAHGESKLVKQDGWSAIVVNQVLNGAKGALPDAKQCTNDKLPVALTVGINVPIEAKTWDDAFKKEMMVRCNLEVDSLEEGGKLLSQKCVTN